MQFDLHRLPQSMIDCFNAILVVAQASGKKTVMSPEEFREVLFWLMVIVTLGIVTGLFGYWIYRKYKNQSLGPPVDATYSLGEMRRLYEDGEISHDEYVAVRAKLLAAAKAMTAATADAAARQPGAIPASSPVPPSPSDVAPPSIADVPPVTPPSPLATTDDEEPII